MNRGSSTTSSNKQKTIFKIVMMGEKGVGKTSLLMRYDKGVFCRTYAVTIGVESFKKSLLIDSEPIYLQLWDTVNVGLFRQDTKDLSRL
jgi:GTPase SAR1 family protein